ncbi:MAG: hypothetical protein COB02_05605 [Candidatus Cloacimonadota bacterium]|nr:MAG: hypothetical protein COB02_05605 [Candidatus Cloacimonadota bacterium]
MKLIFILVHLLFANLVHIYANEHIAEFTLKKGNVFVSGPENQLINKDRGFYKNSFVKVEKNSFALLEFKHGTQIKIDEKSVFKGVFLQREKTIGLQLLKGQYFFNLPEQNNNYEFEIQTPMGIISSFDGDFLIHIDEKRAFLEVFCLDGRLNLNFRNLEIVLVAGESAFVENDRISRKLHIDAAQSRRLFSWYRLKKPWAIPLFLRSFSESVENEEVILSDFVINGLTLNEINKNQTFGSNDLIMGKLRFEGKIENKLPHQLIQMSLDGGKNYFDVPYNNGFLVKRFPKEKQYIIKFRLRDFDKFYKIEQDEINFSYSERGNKEFIENWLETLALNFKRKNAYNLSRMLKSAKTMSPLIIEDLMQEYREVSYQNIEFEVLRFLEIKDRLQIVVKYNKVVTVRSNLEATKESGNFRVLFKQDKRLGFIVTSFLGNFPFIQNFMKNKVDYRGPKVIGSFVVSKIKGANTVIDVSCEDETSKLQNLEYFLDNISTNGRGIKVRPLDGKFDERLEQFRIILSPNFKNFRMYIHGQDARGNWGKFHAITFIN